MKIVLVTHFFPARGGGIEAVADKLVRHLLSSNPTWSIEWFASTGDALPPRTPRLRARPVRAWHGLEKKLNVPCPLWDMRGLALLWRTIRRSDVVHIHDFAYMGNICAALFCLWQGKPFVVTQHIGAVPMKNQWFDRALKFLNNQVGVRILNRAQTCVFVSDEVRRYFAKLGVQGATLIANGVDENVFYNIGASLRNELRAREGISSQTPVAIFAGRFVPKKGIGFVLQLAQQTPEITWILAGRGPLDPEREGMNAPSNVRVIRDRSGSSLADLFRVADALVLPSRGEGFPLVVQEALACGTPALVESSLARALPNVAPWIHALSLEEDAALALWKQQLNFVIQQENEAARIQRAEFAHHAWSWEECARQYASLLVQK